MKSFWLLDSKFDPLSFLYTNTNTNHIHGGVERRTRSEKRFEATGGDKKSVLAIVSTSEKYRGHKEVKGIKSKKKTCG